MDYHNGRISDQILEATNGQGVDKVLIAGGNAADTFEEAVRMLKPGGSIGNVNYLNGHDDVVFNAGDWGVGMGHKTIHGGLMPGVADGKASSTSRKRPDRSITDDHPPLRRLREDSGRHRTDAPQAG